MVFFVQTPIIIIKNIRMKQFAAAALTTAVVHAGSSACLYCRNQDLNGGFLVSYSYCEH